MAWTRDNINLDDLAKVFHAFEETHFAEIGEMKLMDFNVWPLIKRSIFYQYFFYDLHSKKVSRSVLQRTKTICRALKEAKDLFFYKPQNAVLFYVAAPDFAPAEDGKLMNPLMDEFITKGLIKNFIYSSRSAYDAKEPGISAIPIKFHFPLLQHLFATFKIGSKKKKFIRAFAQKYFGLIQTYFSKQGIDLHYSCTDLVFHLSGFVEEYFFFRWILRRLKPSFVITTEQFGTGFMAAAKRHEIQVLDLQHGLLLINDPMYVYAATLKFYKNAMPLPNFIGLFGNYYKALLLRENFWDETQLFVFGNKKIERQRLAANDMKGDFILIPSQGAFFHELVNLLDALGNEREHIYRVIIKLHPLEPSDFEKKYRVLANRFNWLTIADRTENLYDLIARSAAVAGFHSLVLMEALVFKKPVFTFATASLQSGIHTLYGNEELSRAIPLLKCDESHQIHTLFTELALGDRSNADIPRIANSLFEPNYESNITAFAKKYLAN